MNFISYTPHKFLILSHEYVKPSILSINTHHYWARVSNLVLSVTYSFFREHVWQQKRISEACVVHKIAHGFPKVVQAELESLQLQSLDYTSYHMLLELEQCLGF